VRRRRHRPLLLSGAVLLPGAEPLPQCGLVNCGRRCYENDSENDREPDQPHEHLGWGRLPGSRAERHDAHQLSAADQTFQPLPALSAGGSPDSFGRGGGISLSHQASPPRVSQLTLKISHLLTGPLSELCALYSMPTRRFSFLALALCLFTNLLRRCLFALAP